MDACNARKQAGNSLCARTLRSMHPSITAASCRAGGESKAKQRLHYYSDAAEQSLACVTSYVRRLQLRCAACKFDLHALRYRIAGAAELLLADAVCAVT